MLSVMAPPEIDGDVAQFVTSAAEERGRQLFFGGAKCSECHGGVALAEAATSLGGGNQAFDTGVVNLPVNTTPPPECPECPPLRELEAGGLREFSTPPLVGVAATAPFFHDNSVPTLRDAVAFYDSAQFNLSPAATLVSPDMTPLPNVTEGFRGATKVPSSAALARSMLALALLYLRVTSTSPTLVVTVLLRWGCAINVVATRADAAKIVVVLNIKKPPGLSAKNG